MRFVSVVIMLSFLLAAPVGLWGQAVRKVAIDAGHGGSDPGANHSGCLEKDITLKVALKVGEMIRKRFPDVGVVYTRKSDTAVPLVDRSRRSNDAGADLFISIHVNSSVSSSPCGYETFVMGPSKSKQNLDVAMRENNVITYENDYMKVYDGFDPKSAESYILFSLMQDAYFDRSLRFSQLLQAQYARRMPSSSVNRGVKQAGFLVLWRTASPSVLTEIGFISNEAERRYMSSEAGCNAIALSIAEAFAAYKKEMDALCAIPQSAVAPAVKPAAPDKKEPAAKPAENKPSASKPAESKPKPASSSGDNKPARTDSKAVSPSPEVSQRYNPATVRYKIQIKSAASPIKRNSSELKCYAVSAEERLIDGRYKYFVGNVKSYKEALSLQSEVRSKGFADAFVVAFASGNVVSLVDARAVAP